MSKEVGITCNVLLTEHLKSTCLGCGSLQEGDDTKAFGLLLDMRIGLSGMQFFVCELCLKVFLEKIGDLKAQKQADELKRKKADADAK